MPTPSNKKKIVKKTTRTFLRHQTDKFKKMGVSVLRATEINLIILINNFRIRYLPFLSS